MGRLVNRTRENDAKIEIVLYIIVGILTAVGIYFALIDLF